MAISTRISLYLLAALAAAMTLLAGPMVAPSQAAQCRGGDTPAYKMKGKAARKATLCLINKERSQRGLGRLREHGSQRKAASMHNRLMIRTRCFSHQCGGAPDLIGRLVRTGYLPCVCSWSVGENLAWGSGSTSSPRKIVSAWMGSSGHRANILNGRFQHIGIAVGRGSPAGGSDTATFTTDFGSKD